MKKTNTRALSKLALAILLGLGTATFTGCNKNKNESGQEIVTGSSKITFSFAGINDDAEINFRSAEGKSENSIDLVEAGGFDAIITTDNKNPEEIAQPKFRSSAPVENGTTYRVFFYKKDQSNNYVYEKSQQFAAGTTTDVELYNGTYKWVAISYNNTEAINDRGTTDNFTLEDNKDALYAASTSDLNVNADNQTIAVSFQHIYSRIAIELNTLGLFGEMTEASVAVTGLSQSTGTAIDLVTGVVSTGSTTPSAPVFSDFEDIAGNAGQKVAYVYTANTTPQNVQVQFSNLKIKLDDGTIRNFSNSAPVVLTKTITPAKGKNHRLAISLAESAITRAGVQWSRSNLRYAIGNPQPYRFVANNAYSETIDPESYFSFGGHFPRKLGSANEADMIDPCSLVYPAGLWKTPNRDNLNTIENQEGTLNKLTNLVVDLLDAITKLNAIKALSLLGDLLGGGATPDAVTGANYIEYPITSGNNAAYGDANSASNKLRFNFNGHMVNVGVVQELINLNLGDSKGKQAAFWTNQRGTNLLGLGGIGAWSYLGLETPGGILGLGTPKAKGYASASLLNIDLIGLNVTSTGLMNIRCVRDEAWNTKKDDPNYNPMPNLPAYPTN